MIDYFALFLGHALLAIALLRLLLRDDLDAEAPVSVPAKVDKLAQGAPSKQSESRVEQRRNRNRAPNRPSGRARNRSGRSGKQS